MLAGKWVWSLRCDVFFIIEPNDESGANVDASVCLTTCNRFICSVYVENVERKSQTI